MPKISPPETETPAEIKPNLNGEEKKPAAKKSVSGFIKVYRTLSSPLRIVILAVVIASVAAATVLSAYYCWLVWLPQLWAWGFEPIRWTCVFSFLGCMTLLSVPIYPWAFSSEMLSLMFDTYTSLTEREKRSRLEKLENKREKYEKELNDADDNMLIPLINFSKFELEEYYQTNKRQSRRSYANSVMAMWIGFAIIIFGLVVFMVPMPYLNQKFMNDNSLKTLTIGSGIIIELISALFLWIYKSTNEQLTYFYNRQIYVHNALFAFYIAKTTGNTDESKNLIIAKILDAQDSMTVKKKAAK